MSPEQAEGKLAAPRSDIYSLGLIIYEMFTGQYEMFTGQPAFRAETPVALAMKQIHEAPRQAQEVDFCCELSRSAWTRSLPNAFNPHRNSRRP